MSVETDRLGFVIWDISETDRQSNMKLNRRNAGIFKKLCRTTQY